MMQQQTSWVRILSVALPASATFVLGLWAGRELEEGHSVMRAAMCLNAIEQIEAAVHSGDTNAIAYSIREA